MQRKIDILQAHMQAGEWEAAIKLAAKFPRLGKHKKEITRAASAMLSPKTYRSMGKDPNMLVQHGILALKERYANHV